MNAEHTRTRITRHVAGSLALLLFLGLLTGCSGGGGEPTAPGAPVLRITPANGATAVRLDASVILDFGVAVDRSSVERGLHLIAESDMNGVCPDTSMAAHGTMVTVMADSSMLHHMEQFHSTAGHYQWNADGTACTFTPDSLMRGQSRYMVDMSDGMVRMMEQMGGSMMGGTMNASGDMMVHFQTMSADEHAGHH